MGLFFLTPFLFARYTDGVLAILFTKAVSRSVVSSVTCMAPNSGRRCRSIV